MVGGIERLKALVVSRKLARGYYADGGGLYLQVSASGSKSWVFRFRSRLHGRLREMDLGSYHTITLADARDAARACRKLLLEGQDPIQARREARETSVIQNASLTMSFKDCASAYIKAHKAAWKNEKHGKQWEATIAKYADPIFGSRSVSE
jgi:hypothetical protein